jgi:hypothetical protein
MYASDGIPRAVHDAHGQVVTQECMLADGAGGEAVKSRGDIFDFTLGGRRTRNRDPVAAVKEAAQVLCVQLRPEHLPADASVEIAAFIDDFFMAINETVPLSVVRSDDLNSAADWGQWIGAVRESVGEVFSAYQAFVAGQDDRLTPDVSLGLARIAAQYVRWELVDRHVPDADVWALLGQLFVDSVEAANVQASADDGGVVREYLRAIAYQSAALDQLPQAGAVGVCRLVDLVLPFLVMRLGDPQGALYAVNPPTSPIPVRLSRAFAAPGWYFHPAGATEFLAELHGQLIRGVLPPVLAGHDPRLLRDAAVHLRRHWSARPPVRRFRRHLVDGQLLVVRGYVNVKSLFEARGELTNRAWLITDLSRGGVGALIYKEEAESIPESGELIAFRPADGSNWHLGVVRRVRFAKNDAEVGIETLSVRPELVRVDDGRVPTDLFFCDPVQRGEAVRVIAPVGVLREGAPLFVNAGGHVSKLKQLEGLMSGQGFELRAYQAL